MSKRSAKTSKFACVISFFSVYSVVPLFPHMKNIDEIGSENRFVHTDESYAIIGAALDVYHRLGCGFLEPVYQEALALEFGLRSIPFTAQTRLPISYKKFVLNKKYRADFVCFEKVIVEI